ncbi:hypothetical protein [Luteolibacter sp. Populi]|uniref:hypothetical protein n=1 Tax=Luteolibacter sp. Populi TaxID=3230487 RepID=UPI003466C16A
MTNPRRVLITCLTHGTALAAGWFAWSHWRAPAEGKPGPLEAAAMPGAAGKAGELSADEVLASFNAPAEQNKDLKAEVEQNREFDRLVATMEVPADLAAALSKEIGDWLLDGKDQRKPSPMIMALLYHWTIRDPVGMMKWAESDGATQEAMMWHSFQVFDKVVKDKGPGVLAGGLGGAFGSFAAHFMAQGLGGQGADAAQVLALKDTLPEDQWRRLRGQFERTWPFQQKDTLAAVAIAEQQPEMLLEFAKKNGAEGMKWLRGLLADQSLDAGFKGQVTGSTMWQDFVRSGTTMPLDERVKLLGGDEQAQARDLYGQLAEKDLSAILKNGRDWRHAFRHGEADAAEVLAAMAKELPELAGRAPEALRNRLFLELVEEDPERAMTLLEGLPEAEKAQVAMQAAARAFRNIDPNQFMAALGKIPADTPELRDARLEAWSHNTPRNHERLGEDYIAWVRELPPGLDREMALFSLAKTVQARDRALATGLRGELTDASLKKRMEEGR